MGGLSCRSPALRPHYMCIPLLSLHYMLQVMGVFCGTPFDQLTGVFTVTNE